MPVPADVLTNQLSSQRTRRRARCSSGDSDHPYFRGDTNPPQGMVEPPQGMGGTQHLPHGLGVGPIPPTQGDPNPPIG